MINCLVAVEKSQGIGFNGQMPWPHLNGDMSWFRNMTTGQVVIMGSTTYDSLGKSLPNRINVVISRKRNLGDHTFSDTIAAIDFCALEYPDKDIFIIGGSAVYEQYMGVIDRFYVTEIDADYKCDKFFNLTFVKEHFTKVTEHATFTEPVKYTIKEYNI